MLPWWIRHHRDTFEQAILIDNHSTDRSVEIIKDMAPNWVVVKSFNKYFNAALTDLEVQFYEKDLPGWKICLNITEFLVLASSIDGLTGAIEAMHPPTRAVGIPGVIMVDDSPHSIPDANGSLVATKQSGLIESKNRELLFSLKMKPIPARTRFLHRAPIGNYTPGRHSTHLPDKMVLSTELAQIRWFGFSPWTTEFKRRKLQIRSTIDQQDVQVGWGAQHLLELEDLEARRQALLSAVEVLPLPRLPAH